MPILKGKLGAYGPVIEVKVMQSHQRIAALKKRGMAFPQPVTVLGLIDTGASCSALDINIANQLGLECRGIISIHTPSTGAGGKTCQQFDVCLVLGEHETPPLVRILPVVEGEFASQGFCVLIGRDMLAQCTFTYDGKKNNFMLRY
jgi:hypothetical protein